ncbi:hypothetical protein H6F86_05635 [Phormidium sp. FACHB-592]|uniref:Uncharacterized protein n=1 Tax=Stenomitos frigidus AS-A4 TaxID=2933935 RepID=A0ABV0KP45_9CYAN|nr:hypothetical protein [Phormidium sp. FACHB-592]MBD2073373.1 hypothetical protein [Phormidium sp. FACHB-592]
MSRWLRWVFLVLVGFVLASLLHFGLGTVAHATDGAESPVEESAPAVGNDSEFYPIAMSEAVDFLNGQSTPTLQSIVSCLPQRPAYLPVPKFSLLASRELNGETYHYLNVYVDHGFGGQAEPWQTLVKQAGEACVNLIGQPSLQSLTQYVDLPTAVSFAVARYQELKRQNPTEFQSLTRAITSGGGLFVGTTRASFGSPMDDEHGCELFQEDKSALENLGVAVSSKCRAPSR